MDGERFRAWECGYDGLLDDASDPKFPSRLYGVDYLGAEAKPGLEVPVGARIFEIPPEGGVFGFVLSGDVEVQYGNASDLVFGVFHVAPQQFFVTPNGARILLRGAAKVVAAQRLDYLALACMGGPVEPRGRLRYIDGCSDTLLVGPPLQGDPCLNLLHFPVDTDQTQHDHPSARLGIVIRGAGECETPYGVYPLVPGVVFSIPTGTLHKFRTAPGRTLGVIAYHPDSDWGPTHEAHPMVNRTLVDGVKIDNTQGRHAEGEFVKGLGGLESAGSFLG